MKSTIQYQITQSSWSDADELLALQKLSYQIEGQRYNNYDIAPLTQTLEELKAQFKDHTILKAVADGRIIGTVRACEKDQTCYIGRLAVHPNMQNSGIGTALMNEIEKRYASQRYELFAGSKSENNIHLYQKLGYSIFKKDRYETGDIEIFFMEKTKPSNSKSC
jgi:ribosomal protein S18 acetylase RimI-like enzyme